MSKFPGPIHHRSVHVVSVFKIHLLLFSKKKLSVLTQNSHSFVTFILIMCDSKIYDWNQISRWNESNVKIRLNNEDWKVNSPTNQSHHAASFWKYVWTKQSMTTLLTKYSFSDSWLSKRLWTLEQSLEPLPTYSLIKPLIWNVISTSINKSHTLSATLASRKRDKILNLVFYWGRLYIIV